MSGARENKATAATSTPLVALGTLILFFGFVGFNIGQTRLDGLVNGVTISLAVVNTFLAAAGGAFAIILLSGGKWDFAKLCNGSIAGMVSICAGANTVYPWAGLVIGFIAGIVYICWSAVVSTSPLAACNVAA